MIIPRRGNHVNYPRGRGNLLKHKGQSRDRQGRDWDRDGVEAGQISRPVGVATEVPLVLLFVTIGALRRSLARPYDQPHLVLGADPLSLPSELSNGNVRNGTLEKPAVRTQSSSLFIDTIKYFVEAVTRAVNSSGSSRR